MTIVKGLETLGVNQKKAAKHFGQKFACSASVKGAEIVIQGDCLDQVIDLIQTSFEIDEKKIKNLGNLKEARKEKAEK